MKKTIVKYIGYIIQCTDRDNGDQINIELLINGNVKAEDFDRVVADGATRDHRVGLSGNMFDFDCLGLSGRVVQKTIIREELEPITEGAQKLLEQFKMG